MAGMDTSPALAGLRIIEFAGIGPGPFAGMMLADMGAEVIRIDRLTPAPGPAMEREDGTRDFLARGRQSIALDLKDPAGVALALRLIETADGLIEGFRPGVMERLGLGPEDCHARNPRLVYGRMTGWGQAGPLAQAAGHDLNYIALTGALWATGPKAGRPVFPLNLLGDFGGGGMFLAFGMVSAMLKAARTGQGDVVDAAICDGVASLMTFVQGWRAMGLWQDRRESNLLDGGVPWYDVYECSDGQWISIAALEPQFWACLLERLGLSEAALGNRADPATWPGIRAQFETVFASQPRAHWVSLLEGSDACFAPVLSPAEAGSHPHMAARRAYGTDGAPAAAPRFAHADPVRATPPPLPGRDTRAVLQASGLEPAEIEALLASGVAAEPGQSDP